jgi:hypothetical protein
MARLAGICAKRKLALHQDAQIGRDILMTEYDFPEADALQARELVRMLPGLTGGGSLGDAWLLSVYRGALLYRGVEGPSQLRTILEEESVKMMDAQRQALATAPTFALGGPVLGTPDYIEPASSAPASIESAANRRDPIPIDDRAIDPELWDHVRVLVQAEEWDKLALTASVFVENKLREWAKLPGNMRGSTQVFKAALATDKFALGDQPSEQQGWQQLGTGFALALRNPSGHRIDTRGDAERYALGVLGPASLFLTEIRHVYGDAPRLP